MAAGSTYTPIATTTSTGTTTITMSSIPSTYTDIIMVIKGQIDGNVYYKINGDTNSNFSQTTVYGTGSGSGASSRETSLTTGIYLGDYIGSPMASTGAMAIIHFMNYSNTTTNKTSLYRMDNAGAGTQAGVGLWRSTAAINQVSVTSSTANGIANGTTFTLYGIQAA